MKTSDASQGESPSEMISKRIAELGDWRGKTLGRMRAQDARQSMAIGAKCLRGDCVYCTNGIKFVNPRVWPAWLHSPTRSGAASTCT